MPMQTPQYMENQIENVVKSRFLCTMYSNSILPRPYETGDSIKGTYEVMISVRAYAYNILKNATYCIDLDIYVVQNSTE